MIDIARLIGTYARNNPHKIAIKHNGDTITYQELEKASNQIAFFLKSSGFRSGDIIAVAMDRSIQMSVCLYGIMKAGAAYLPVDPNLPVDRVSFIIKDSSAKTLIISKNYTERYKDQVEKLVFDDVWEARNNHPSDALDLDIINNLAYVLYTSGSTGVPKGVGVAHHNFLNLLQSVQKLPGVTEEDKVLGITTMSFDISELELFLPLISGAQLIILDTDIAKDGRALAAFIEEEKLSIVQATPFTWKMMLEYGWDKHFPIKAFCGGEAMSRDLAGKLLERCDEVWNMYGPTETTIYSIIKKVTKDDKIITIGRPIDNTDIYILDEDLNEVSAGNEGEIYIGGAGVASGYINRPELTAERFIDDKFSKIEGKKIYRTGDLGKVLENGEIQCLGRIDHQVKIRGFRIETDEIVYQLKQQKNIKDAYVILYEDAVENLRLVAYIAPKTVLTNSDIKNSKDKLSEVLPDYMVPTDYVVIPFIPVMTNGKIDRKALPSPELGKNVADYVAPVTELEKSITDIWIRNIGIKSIGTNDNFFNLGGNSLLAAKTMTQIEKLTGKRLSLANLFKYPTIKELAACIDNPIDTPYRSLVAIKPKGNKLPLYIVHGIGLNVLNFRSMVFNLDEDQPVYGMQSLGLDHKTEQFDDMEQIAAAYNSEIMMHNPNGPYLIAGYSFGGYIAYEMVRQLKALGKDVSMLAMFDTNLQHPTHQYSFFKKIYKKAFRQIPKFLFRIKSITEQPKENVSYLKMYYGHKFAGLYKNTDFQDEHDPENLPDFMQKIADKLLSAFNRYVIVPVDIRIDLFKAKKRLFFVDDPEYLGWKDYAKQGVNVHVVPGDHKDMFTPPNDAVLAEILQKRLDELNN
ncbi:MAG: amino acid adenylation domain-containing protein [Mucilaginibacter sp.]